jgi:hypothetical protein
MKRMSVLSIALALAPLAALAGDYSAPPPPAAVTPRGNTVAAADTAAGAAGTPSIPAMDCKKPDLNATGTRMTRDTGAHDLQAEAQAYLDCVKDYASKEKGLAQAYGDAANKAVNEYNDFVKEVNDYQSRPKN